MARIPETHGVKGRSYAKNLIIKDLRKRTVGTKVGPRNKDALLRNRSWFFHFKRDTPRGERG